MDKRFEIAGVAAQTPLRDAAPALLEAKAAPLFELERAARGGADMDAVHDMRVASRRLREAMRLLAPIYPAAEFKAWYRRVRRVTRSLGPVRDSDVFIDGLSHLAPDLGPGGQRCVAFAVGHRMGTRVAELKHLNRELVILDLAKSRKEFHKLVRAVPDSPEAARPFADFGHAAISERGAVVAGAQPAALDEANIAQQHALRIDYKRLRYAVEAFAPCYGDAFGGLHAVLTSFQDTLGALHDIRVFHDMLREPAHIEAAQRAGVSADDVVEVEATLEERARVEFERFVGLAADNPPDALLSSLLRPLERSAEPDADLAQGLAQTRSGERVDTSTPPAEVDQTPWSLEWVDGVPEALIES